MRLFLDYNKLPVTGKMIIGIPNIRNNCYASSVLQCMMRTMGENISIPGRLCNGEFQDADEFYLFLVDKLPDEYRNMFTIRIDGNTHYRLSFDEHGACLEEGIETVSDVIVAYMAPKLRKLSDFNNLRFRSRGKTVRYSSVGFVCAVPGHYYAVIHDVETPHETPCVGTDGWYKCDDDRVSPLSTDEHYVYMVFFLNIGN